jgi:hypothetical protein
MYVRLGAPRLLRQLLVKRLDFFQIIRAESFKVQHGVVRTMGRPNDFVKLQLYGRIVTVLAILDQKHHQKCNDGSSRIDYQLPAIAIVKQRSGDSPKNHNANG